MPRPVVFVTGAGRGVGRAIARRFARAGYGVAAAGRTESSLRALVDAIVSDGGEACALRCDVTERASVEAAAAGAETRLGPIDVLVNNAGAAESAPFARMDDEQWRRMLDVNLTGTYYCMRVVLPGMLARRAGRVINIASTAGRTGFRYTAAYCAAKHGVVGLTRAVAIEMAGSGITVNAICPGWTDTDMTAGSIARISETTGRTHEEARAALERMNPQGRLVDPDEIAALALFLASPEGRGINGQTLGVDGGEVLV